MKKKLGKKKGNFQIAVAALFTFLLLFILFNFEFTKYKIACEGELTHTQLVSTNLAAFSTKNLDLDLLSQSPGKKLIMVKNPIAALKTWEDHLKYNFGLNESYEPKYSTSFIKSKVDVKEFILYNVNVVTNNVTEYDLNTDTGLFKVMEHVNGKGNIKTPKGNIVNVTTIHSTVGFTIDTMLNKTKYVEISEDTGVYKK